MEHKNLTLEYDKNLIEGVIDDKNTRYILLFLYIIRNDLFKDLRDKNLIESYERVLLLDEIYKNNIKSFLNSDFIEIAIDLGLIKNIRSIREFEQKDDDYIMKLGEETITIENNKISVPDDTLYLMVSKKFKEIQRRNFNVALIKLKGVRCEKTNTIHNFIFEIGEHDYVLSDDIYYILEQYGNIYQTIKIEITIEAFNQRFKEIQEKVNNFIKKFEPILNSQPALKKINKAIEENKNIFDYLKQEKIELSKKFNFEKIDTQNSTYLEWNTKLINFLNLRFELDKINKKLEEIRNYYSGKRKNFKYLEFIEKVSFNDEGIVNKIQESLIKIREDLVKINKKISVYTEKELELLNLDYERFFIMSSD